MGVNSSNNVEGNGNDTEDDGAESSNESKGTQDMSISTTMFLAHVRGIDGLDNNTNGEDCSNYNGEFEDNNSVDEEFPRGAAEARADDSEDNILFGATSSSANNMYWLPLLSTASC